MNMRINKRPQQPDTNIPTTPIPDSAQRQLDQIIGFLCEELTRNLVGIYLHGSLTMGCFNATTSDIDLLVITHGRPGNDALRAVVAALLTRSSQPHPVEISLVHYTQITPWRHPAPFDLHFSEAHRAHYTRLLADTNVLVPTGGVDPDLAAHYTVLATRGRALFGAPVDALMLDIPWPDYVDALRGDFEWSQTADNAPATYAVLNACRIWAAVTERAVLSKAEGAHWALRRAPSQFHRPIREALSHYCEAIAKTTPEPVTVCQTETADFLQWIRQQVGW